MTRWEDAQYRSQLLSDRIRARTDVDLRTLIDRYQLELVFTPLDNLMISEKAWSHVTESDIPPRAVFAHPDLLCHAPKVTSYYRGLALLPQKRVVELAHGVSTWEDGSLRQPVTHARALVVARLFNCVTSSIIEGATSWTLENGYRNIISTMAIGLDGSMRNIIGRDAEAVVKERIRKWLQAENLLADSTDQQSEFELPRGYSMYYKPEPDIEFKRVGSTVATIEIKGGRDPAGALERLGAMTKSFEATPSSCRNMLVAGVVTPEMKQRLQKLGVTVFPLDDVNRDGPGWVNFLNEVFHHTVRITGEITSG